MSDVDLVARALGVAAILLNLLAFRQRRRDSYLHLHRYYFHEFRHIRDADFGTYTTERYGTCIHCGKAKTKRVRGAWEPVDERPTRPGVTP